MAEQKSLLSEMSITAKLSLLAGVVIIGIIAIGAIIWVNKVPYESVLTAAGREDMARAVQELHTRNISYRISDDGLSLQVQSPEAGAARMALADLGLPFDNTVGLEMFETSDFGVTEFAQRINYKRALEGELTRTISAMAEVRYARVHLVLPEKALLKSNTITPSAAITLFLRKDTQLTPAQIIGIQSLVDASVPGLNRSDVTVLNQSGQQLSASDVSVDSAISSQSDQIEQTLQVKIESLLAQRFYSDQFRVTVNADIESQAIRRIEERPLKAENGDSALSRRTSTSDYSSENTKPSTKVEEAFVVGQLREEVTIPGGQITRLSIAVWITANMSADEQTEIERILNVSVGISEERGDRLVVLVTQSGLEKVKPDLEPNPKVGETSVALYQPMGMSDWQSLVQQMPNWVLYSVGVLVALVFTLLFIVLLLLRGASKARLTKSQRELLLNNLNMIVREQS